MKKFFILLILSLSIPVAFADDTNDDDRNQQSSDDDSWREGGTRGSGPNKRQLEAISRDNKITPMPPATAPASGMKLKK